MYMIAEVSQYVAVASFAEAWIEIFSSKIAGSKLSSPPSRRRGLKLKIRQYSEIRLLCRLLRGGVD